MAPVEDYRHAGATAPTGHLPPAAIATDGRRCPHRGIATPIPPGLNPALRAGSSSRAGALPPLVEKTTRQKLTAEKAAPLAEPHVLLSCMERIMQTR